MGLAHRMSSLVMMAVLIAVGKAEAQVPRERDAGRIREKIDKSVRDEMTRLWYPRAVEREKGGFHQTFGRDWSALPDTNRFLVYQARMVWTAAEFAEFGGVAFE